MKKLWKEMCLLLAAILSFGVAITVAEVAPVSAYLSTCSVSNNYALDVASAHCATYGAHGGLNQVRIVAHCAAPNGASVYGPGPWVTGINNYSYEPCSDGPPYTILVSGSYYQTQ